MRSAPRDGWAHERATLVYRRSGEEMPARAEEVKHAKQEGVEFRMLTDPMEFLGDEKGWLTGARCVRMELGEPDASGRRSPVEIKGSEFILPANLAIIGVGTTANPLIQSTTPDLKTTSRNYIVDRPGDHPHLQARRLCRRRYRHRRRHGDSRHGRGPQGRRVHPRIPDHRRVGDNTAQALVRTPAQLKCRTLNEQCGISIFLHCRRSHSMAPGRRRRNGGQHSVDRRSLLSSGFGVVSTVSFAGKVSAARGAEF